MADRLRPSYAWQITQMLLGKWPPEAETDDVPMVREIELDGICLIARPDQEFLSPPESGGALQSYSATFAQWMADLQRDLELRGPFVCAGKGSVLAVVADAELQYHILCMLPSEQEPGGYLGLVYADLGNTGGADRVDGDFSESTWQEIVADLLELREAPSSGSSD